MKKMLLLSAAAIGAAVLSGCCCCDQGECFEEDVIIATPVQNKCKCQPKAKCKKQTSCNDCGCEKDKGGKNCSVTRRSANLTASNCSGEQDQAPAPAPAPAAD